MRPALAVVVLAVLLTWSGAARADLEADADALIAAWSKGPARARRIRTVFLHEGEARRVAVAQRTFRGNKRRPCLTIAAIGERHLRFRLAAGGSTVDSRAGVAMVRDCRGRVLQSGVVELTSAARSQGAVEVIGISHGGKVAAVRGVLRERAAGPSGHGVEEPSALTPDPLAARAARARRAARLDGAALIMPVAMTAGAAGTGAAVLKLSQGCHRLAVLAEIGGQGVPVDVDAEAGRYATDDIVARDRSHAPDARLDFCLGEAQRVEVRFVGAPPGAEVTILAALWPMPPGLGESFAPEVRGGLAWALHRRRAPVVSTPPVARWMGAPGTTIIPMLLEPGACYAAAMALSRGDAAAGRLSAQIGARVHFDDAFDPPHSAAITFCAGDEDLGKLVVDVRSRNAWWTAAVWRLGDGGG